jgi:hypothetical protein
MRPNADKGVFFIAFERGEHMSIQPGDLILVRGIGWTDRVIESVTHSPYSHVAGLVKTNELIEAQAFRRVGYQALDYYAGGADVYTCDALTDAQRAQIVEYVKRAVGYRYDYLLLAVEAARYLLHVCLPYREPFRSRICSTLWSDAYRAAGVDLCPGIRYPSPGDIAQSKLLRKVGPF